MPPRWGLERYLNAGYKHGAPTALEHNVDRSIGESDQAKHLHFERSNCNMRGLYMKYFLKLLLAVGSGFVMIALL